VSEGREPPGVALLQAAIPLLYREGITGCTVESLTRAAGVSKPSLYQEFGGKEGLALAYLAKRNDDFQSWFSEQMCRAPDDAVDRVLYTVDVVERFAAGPLFCGCAFLNAATESQRLPATARVKLQSIVLAQKASMRDMLQAELTRARYPDPKSLADELLLLLDGTLAHAVFRPVPECFEIARRSVRRLLGIRVPTDTEPTTRG
jgi:AcrR family transcriptional regulator